MSPPTVQDFVIRRGRTFQEFVRWESEPFEFAAISAISQVAPVGITTQGAHGLPAGWRVAVVGAVGLTELNAQTNPPSDSDFRRATVVDGTHIAFNDLSGAEFGRHKANSGFLQFYTPHSLAGYVARMSIKNKAGGTVLLTSIDSGDIVITLDDTAKTITLEIDAAATEPLTWKAGVYDLELEDGDGFVTVILTGKVSVVQEVTTPITP